MRRFIIAIVVIAVLGLVAHDAWRFATAKRTLSETTLELTRWADEHASQMGRDDVARELVKQASPVGVRVTKYDQTEMQVSLWTEIDVTDTLFAATAANMALGKSYEEARVAPWVLHDARQTLFQ
jgi:Tfp pilus assembly protein PilE